MSDTTDNQVLRAAISDPVFQDRCRLRFINAAIAVTAESTGVTSHTQRLAFAGALFAGTVDLKMLAMLIIANPTNAANCLANPSVAGGNITDANVDFQVNSVITGVSLSRAW